MRFLTFLFSLLLSAGVLALTYFNIEGSVDDTIYLAASTAIGVVFALIIGHFMYRASFHKKQAKLANQRADDAELRIHDLETQRLQEASQRQEVQQNTTNMTPEEAVAFENGHTQVIKTN